MEGIFWPMRALFSEDDAVELARAADNFPNALSKAFFARILVRVSPLINGPKLLNPIVAVMTVTLGLIQTNESTLAVFSLGRDNEHYYSVRALT